jgi:hypothetical protein
MGRKSQVACRCHPTRQPVICWGVTVPDPGGVGDWEPRNFREVLRGGSVSGLVTGMWPLPAHQPDTTGSAGGMNRRARPGPALKMLSAMSMGIPPLVVMHEAQGQEQIGGTAVGQRQQFLLRPAAPRRRSQQVLHERAADRPSSRTRLHISSTHEGSASNAIAKARRATPAGSWPSDAPDPTTRGRLRSRQSSHDPIARGPRGRGMRRLPFSYRVHWVAVAPRQTLDHPAQAVDQGWRRAADAGASSKRFGLARRSARWWNGRAGRPTAVAMCAGKQRVAKSAGCRLPRAGSRRKAGPRWTVSSNGARNRLQNW